MRVDGDAQRRRGAIGSIPSGWADAIETAASPERIAPIADFVAAQPNTLPRPDLVFAALRATPFNSVRAVILGQDPYPTRTHAMGLAFSVPRDLPQPLPRSLKNIHAELLSDLGLTPPGHG
jgi:uracil-DNA glycosylase